VLEQLRVDFPGVTIPKIRFLEDKGLIKPERTPAGYRKFSAADVDRLRYVLRMQRDHYLPLKVIGEHLDAIDRGLEPPAVGGAAPRVPRALVSTDGLPSADDFVPQATVRLSRKELAAESGLDEETLRAVEQYGLIDRPSTGFYDGDALMVAKTVAEMSRFGIEPRHLRAYRAAADREIGLFEQVAAPLLRQRNPEARARAQESVRELAALSVRLHATLVRAGLREELGD
jgi:DNA-binding transcriptional MerR regulator